jgi:DNA-binding HxlR family transcriptional regulator
VKNFDIWDSVVSCNVKLRLVNSGLQLETHYAGDMPRSPLSRLECSVANTVEIVNDPWTVLILRDAFQGLRRFDQFVESLGIARNTLASRLDRLVTEGLMEMVPYQDRPVRHEYVLTDRGKDLFDVLMTLWSYGERWNPPSDPGHQRAIHLDCGEDASAVTHCGYCGERLTRKDVRIFPPNPIAERIASASTA